MLSLPIYAVQIKITQRSVEDTKKKLPLITDVIVSLGTRTTNVLLLFCVTALFALFYLFLWG